MNYKSILTSIRMKRVELKRKDCGCRKVVNVENDQLEEFLEAHMDTHDIIDISEVETES